MGASSLLERGSLGGVILKRDPHFTFQTFPPPSVSSEARLLKPERGNTKSSPPGKISESFPGRVRAELCALGASPEQEPAQGWGQKAQEALPGPIRTPGADPALQGPFPS